MTQDVLLKPIINILVGLFLIFLIYGIYVGLNKSREERRINNESNKTNESLEIGYKEYNPNESYIIILEELNIPKDYKLDFTDSETNNNNYKFTTSKDYKIKDRKTNDK